MRIKRLVAIAIMGLFATSVVLADPADNINPNNNAINGSGALNSQDSNVIGSDAMTNGNPHANDPSQGAIIDNDALDQGISDTATGDDDY